LAGAPGGDSWAWAGKGPRPNLRKLATLGAKPGPWSTTARPKAHLWAL